MYILYMRTVEHANKKTKPKPRNVEILVRTYLQQKRMYGYNTENESFAVHIDLSELYITNAWQDFLSPKEF